MICYLYLHLEILLIYAIINIEENVMKNKKLLNLQIDNMYIFVKVVFKDGLVPQTREKFIASLSTETTDGSLCMAYDFGDREKDETAMIFFYPQECAVPPKYHKHLKDKYNAPWGIEFLNNDYLRVSSATSINIKFQKQLLEKVQVLQRVAKQKCDIEVELNKAFYSMEEAKEKNTELLQQVMEYELDLIQLSNYVKKRIKTLSESTSGGGNQAETER